MKPFYRLPTALLSLTFFAGIVSCQASSTSQFSSQTSNPYVSNSVSVSNAALTIAPWSKPAINNSKTDAVYHQQWMKAESKSLCPIIALPKQASSHLKEHRVRRAEFASGWGVAYDLPDIRSAYGVANAGTINPNDINYNWPYNITYQDGSMVGYGHEGGNPTAKWLAYIVIPQNNCFYNIWSAQDKAHLEQMISDLRMVRP